MSNSFDYKRLHMLEFLIEELDRGILVCDREGRIIIYNQAYSNIDNLPVDNVIGQLIEKNYLIKKNESTLRTVMKTKKSQLLHRQRYTTISGTEVDVLKDTYPIFDGEEIIGAYSIVRDVYNAKNFALNILNTLTENARITNEIYDFSKITFKSKKMKQNVKILNEINGRNIAFFIDNGGEGKEFALLTAKQSYNCLNPIFFNCASIEETDQNLIFFGKNGEKGILEKSLNSVVILENIEYLTIQMQVRITEFITNNKINIFTVFNNTQTEIISSKKLNIDFFYKLNDIGITIPPLCERKEDLLVYVNLICNNLDLKISADAYSILISYDWAGNYLELLNVLKNASVQLESGVVTEKDLPDYIKNFKKDKKNTDAISFSSLTETLDYTEKEIIKKTLEDNNYNITKSANELGISRQNLQYRMKRLLA